MTRLHRRAFLAGSAATMAAAAWTRPAAFAALGANERIRVAVIGTRVRGRTHLAALSKQPNVEVVAVCDVDPAEAGAAVETSLRWKQRKPEIVSDLRRVLDDKSIDAVTIAAPNHWHALAAIWACQAGKDVYVEKPLSQTLAEGQKLIEAATKYGRIVQHGTQQRSCESVRAAMEFMHAGKLGKLTHAIAVNYKRRAGIGRHTAPGKIPPGVDYDLWLGPAPKADLARINLHYDWHWFWETGSGDIGNQGVHQIDLALWALGKTELPRAVVSAGGRFGEPDDGQTPNTQSAWFDYGDCELLCEVRNLASQPHAGAMTGNVFYGSAGRIVRDLKDHRCRAYLNDQPEPIVFGGEPANSEPVNMDTFDRDHFANFFAAVRSRDAVSLRSDARVGHIASGLCHLANISHRLGQSAALADVQSQAQGVHRESLARMGEHLAAHAAARDVARETQTVQWGQRLEVDPATQTIRNNPAATALTTRQYRAPFVLPDLS